MTNSEKETRLADSIVAPGTSISQAMAQLERAGIGALLLCDADRRLCGLLTDGDIRRAILQGRSLDDSCSAIATLNPVKVEAPVTPEDALRIMNAHDIHHLPAVDAAGRVQDLVLRQDLAVDRRSCLERAATQGGNHRPRSFNFRSHGPTRQGGYRRPVDLR